MRVGTLVPSDRGVFVGAGLFDVRDRNGTTVLGKLGLTQEILRREGLLNTCLVLLPAHGMHSRRRSIP